MTKLNVKNSWRFWTVLALIFAGGALVQVWERAGEAHVQRKNLKEFPAALGAWRQQGVDYRFDKESEAVLRADDYLSREYTNQNGERASLYVGYYNSQRTGATYHSPLNCLPGAGWTMSGHEVVQIKPTNGAPAFEANRYVIEKDGSRQVVIYWYEGRGRKERSEYWGKIYTVIDSASRRRSDGAMVRVMTPVRGAEEDAFRRALDLASNAAPQLPAYVPD